MINNDANKVDYWRSLAQACKDIADSFEKQNAALKEENEALQRICQADTKLMEMLNNEIQSLKARAAELEKLNEGLVFENRRLRNYINNLPFPGV